MCSKGGGNVSEVFWFSLSTSLGAEYGCVKITRRIQMVSFLFILERTWPIDPYSPTISGFSCGFSMGPISRHLFVQANIIDDAAPQNSAVPVDFLHFSPKPTPLNSGA